MNKLFSHHYIGNLKLKNRIIMTAIHTGLNWDDEKAFLLKRVIGGAAYVTMVMAVSPVGAYNNMAIIDDEKFQSLRDLCEEVHNDGGKIFIQLFHLGRNGNLNTIADRIGGPVAPSPIASPIYRQVPRELTTEEIKEIRNQFNHGAQLCKNAGVDGIEISCSAGYLLSQFISPLTNKRIDEYGGSDSARIKFPLEVIQGVRKSVGTEYPVIIRVSAGDMLGGYGIDEVINFLKFCESQIDGVNVTGGWHESPIPQISMQLPQAGFAFLAKKIKDSINKPVIACNRINDSETAKKIINDGFADFVGCARAFLIDADFANKIRKNKSHRICIGCNKGCIENVLKGKQVTCIFNPWVGRESIIIKKKEESKKILIVGGGPAGMQAALEMKKAGYKVRLCERNKRLGGLMNYAGLAPHKETFFANILAMHDELIEANVEVLTSVEVDERYISEYKPDLVVLAIGSNPKKLNIKGNDRENVYFAEDILAGDEKLWERLLKGKIFIIGGGAVGLETALFLSEKSVILNRSYYFIREYGSIFDNYNLQLNSPVTILEISDKVGQDLGGLRRYVIGNVKERGIKVIKNAELISINKDSIGIVMNGERQEMECQTVIVSVGYESRISPLQDWLKKEDYAFKIIGDALKVGTVNEAVKSNNEFLNYNINS